MLVVFTHAKVCSSLVSLWQYSIWLFETSNLVGCYTSSAALTCGIVGLYVPSPLAIFQTSLEAVENGMSSTSSRTSNSYVRVEESDFQEKGLSFPLLELIGSYLIMMKKTRQRFKFMEFGGLHEMMILFGITP